MDIQVKKKKKKGIFSYCSHVQSEFPLYSVEVLRAGRKISHVRLQVGLDSGWDVEGWGGWLQLSFVHSSVCAVPQSIDGRTAPFPFLPRQTQICTSGKSMTTASEEQQLARQDNHSGCLCHAACCRSGRKTFPFCHGEGKWKSCLWLCRSFWDAALLSCLPPTEASSQNNHWVYGRIAERSPGKGGLAQR